MARFFYKGSKAAVASSNSDLHGFGPAIRKVLARGLPREKARVLDVGTGFGMNAAFLARSLPRGSSVWTVDPSKEVLKEVEASLNEEGVRGVRFVEATADRLPFEDGYFAQVSSVMVLHHIEGLGPALAEMWRVLRPGGSMVVVDFTPEASHELEFKSRHDEEDFFAPAAVAETVARLGTTPAERDYGLWYAVRAVKRPRAPRRAGRAAPARPRAG